MTSPIHIIAALVAVLLCAPVGAQKRMALVIGNSDYAFETKLGNPVNDARVIARTLRGLGFTVDERTNLRQRDMTLAISKFTRESAGADTALVYFAGHGMQPASGGRNYLLPVDANIESDDALDSDGIAADRVVEQMERNANPAKLRVVVLDACRNNPRVGRTRGSLRGLARMSPGDDYTLIAFSTNDQDVAQDGTGANSPYAEALNRHLARARELPLRRIFELTATDVRAATAQKQRPRTYGDLDSRVGLDGVVLVSVVPEPSPMRQPAAGPTPAQVEQQFWELIKDSRDIQDFKEYLQRYPNGIFSSLALRQARVLTPSPSQSAATVLEQLHPSPSLGAASAGTKRYDPGATDKEIKIGGISPYSGPASAYGTIGKAIGAYFEMVNAEGGVNGRRLNFVSLDDGYNPAKTVEQTRKLVEEEEVLFIFNTLGTPPNSAIHRYMNTKKLPQLFVASGATKWGDSKGFPWTMGWQPSYQTEGFIFAKHILDTKPNAKIAVLMQNDDYGKDYFKGFEDGLGDKKSLIVAKVTYEVTAPTIDSQMVSLKASGADVFFNITTPKFAAQAIKKAAEVGWKPVHYLNSVSTSVSAVLGPAGFDNAEGIITTMYAKDPTDPQFANDASMKDWAAWMKKYYPSGNPADALNVYGYNVAQTLVQVLKQAGDNLTRDNIMKQAANLDMNLPMLLPGVNIKTGPDDYYPIERERLVRFDGKTWQLFGKVYGR